MVHCHLLREVGVVQSNAVEGPLGNQPIQHPIAIGEPLRAVFNPMCRLHTDNKEEITEVEIFCRIPVPGIAVRGVDTSHQRLRSGVWYGGTAKGIASTEMRVVRSGRDGTIIVRTRDKVAVADITRHGKNEGGRFGL